MLRLAILPAKVSINTAVGGAVREDASGRRQREGADDLGLQQPPPRYPTGQGRAA
jgi:hypothetical protein